MGATPSTTPVATTSTAADKLEEVRRLNIEVATLTSATDIARRAAKEAEDAATEARGRAEGLKATIQTLEASQTAVGAELREFVAECRNVLQAIVMTMELAAQSAKDLSAEVDKLVAEIKKRTKELDDIRIAFSKENEQMSIKRDDLEIWEDRVREAAALHLPGQKIIL